MTKLQRHTAYIILLAESVRILKNIKVGKRSSYYDGGYINGMCELLANILEEDEILFDILETHSLKELIWKKPEKNCCYWFENNEDGWNKRIEILKQCIQETY